MPPASSAPNSYRVEEMAYPSRTIAFQAAGMMTSIVENLQAHNEIRYTPAFMYVEAFTEFSQPFTNFFTVYIACSRL